MALSDIYQKASLVQIPSGYKAADDKLYSVVPSNGNGDFTIDSDADATRVNKDGLIESVVADQARLNYNPSSPQDPHLLLEPTRTNECLYSKTLSSWSELNGGSLQTITDNDAIAPDGSLTASTITFTDTGTSLLRQFSNKAYTSNKHSSSFYAKKISGNGSVFFGITDTETEFTPTDEWIRYEVNNVTPTDFGTNLFLDLNFDCSEGDKIAVWGMQLEEGTYSTSIVKTAGSAVTRTVDKCLNAGDANLFNDSEGTLFVDLENFDATVRELTLSDGSADNRITLLFYGSTFGSPNRIRFYLTSDGSVQADSLFAVSYTFNQRNKIAFKYKQNDFKAYINGTQVFSDTNGNTPIGLSDFEFSDFNGTGGFIEGKIHQAMVFNEALTDSELQTLTS
jgi:hypothetical protein